MILNQGACSGKSDGLHSSGHCSSSFLQCSNGIAHQQQCSIGLIYNAQTQKCDFANNVQGCGQIPSQIFPKEQPQVRAQPQPQPSYKQPLQQPVEAARKL